MEITISSLYLIFNKIIDIIFVWTVIYFCIKNFKDNVKLLTLIKGVIFILLLKVVADIFNLVTIGLLLEYVIMWGPLGVIIIFQPEIRLFLEELGRQKIITNKKMLSIDEREKIIYEIISAVENLRKERFGALIAIERNTSLSDYISKSKPVYADITSNLLQCIFYKNNPLHDGAVIIQSNKISCAGAIFPTSLNLKLNQKKLGTRHRAALGISEETDAIVLVVSEETGRLSIAVKGELYYNLSIDDFRMALIDEMRPQKYENKDFKTIEEEEIYEENK